jgi:hypothetical protein
MESRAAPSEDERPRVHAPDARWLADLPGTDTIRLSAPSENERATHAHDGIRDSVGFGRRIDGARARLVAARGQSALRFSVVSSGALHVRAALELSDSAQYRITAYRPGEESAAVSLYRRPGESAPPHDTVWTPVTDGDTQVVVVERLGEAPSDWSVSVPQISHLDRPLYRTAVGPELNFRSSAPCQVDMACIYQVAPTAMQAGVVKANFGVALMIFTQSDGLTYTCTGTLLNNANYPSPIFLTAHHCLDGDEAVASLTTVWFYNRTACNNGPPNQGAVQVAGGATSLFGSASLDAALVQLNQMPPTLATYVGWDATPMQPNTPILAIHHPRGDVKKASFGTEVEVEPDPVPVIGLGTFPGGTFYLVSWDLGMIEPGSSGSGLLSFDAATGLFYLRGTLTAGSNFTCDSIGKATTFYSRFDNLYPYIETTLNGGSPAPAATGTAVEYYYADWNFYFETAFPDEIAALDGGAFGGVWKRTGQTFKVWTQPTVSAALDGVPGIKAAVANAATCRFFSTIFDPKSSHFYTPFDAECASLKAGNAWQYEGIAFYLQLADANGLCPAGSVPLYRLYDNGMGGAPNHRYTTSLEVFNQQAAAGWTFEGNGDTKVFACVPQ